MRIAIKESIELMAKILKGELRLTLFKLPNPPMWTFGSTVIECVKKKNRARKA